MFVLQLGASPNCLPAADVTYVHGKTFIPDCCCCMHRAVPDATVISVSSSASVDISSSSSREITLGGQHPGTINIITELGPFTTHFLGTCSWLSDTDFEYCINQIRIDVAGQSLTLPMPVKLQNLLTFFLVTPELACARSQLGGTMLLQANPEKGKRYFSAW